MEMHHFIKYTSPPIHLHNCESCPEDLRDEILDWKERMKYIHEDIDWLLRLPGEEFWQQIINDETFSVSFDSFWQFCPRPYDLQQIPNQCVRIQEEIRKLFLLLFLRICSDTNLDGFTDQSHASLLYDNFLLDVPKILDVCCIYEKVNPATKQFISNALQSVFRKQPGYWNDLNIAIDSIFRTFDSIAERFCLLDNENDSQPKQLQNQSEANYSSKDLDDVIMYLYDTANSLHSLIAICGFTSRALLEKGSLKRVAVIIDKLLPRLRDLFGSELTDSQRKYFKGTKRRLLQFSYSIFDNCFFSQGVSNSNDKKLLQEFLDTVSLLLSDTRFLISFEKRYKLSGKLREFQMKSNDDHVDAFEYIQQVIKSLVPEEIPQNEEIGAAASLSNQSIEQLVKQVKGMFPDETNEFLRAAVVHFDGDPDKVAIHIIENNLPPYLEQIRNPKQEPAPISVRPKERVAQGTLPGHFYMKTDKISKSEYEEIFTSTQKSKDILRNARLAADNESDREFLYDEYDDEYDDTYDSHNIGAMDADSGDELRDKVVRRSFVTPKVLQALEKGKISDEEDEEEGKSGGSDEENDNEQEENTPKNGTTDTVNNFPDRGRGNSWRRGRGHDRRPRHWEGRNERFDGDQQGHLNNERERPPNRGRRGGGPRGEAPRGGVPRGGASRGGASRGSGSKGGPQRGRSGKKHGQKSLALKKSAKGMAGI